MTMPGVVGAAYIDIKPRLTNFTQPIRSELSKAAGAADTAGKDAGSKFASGFASQSSPGFFRSHIGAITTAVVAGFGAVVAAGAAMGVKTAASMEQAQVAFSTLLHSSVQAQAFLKQLSAFAAATPFTLPGIVDASRQLLGVGEAANKVIPTLRAWGDTAGALGLSQEQFSRAMLALTQAMANGKVQAGDMLQITQAGIPIWSILARSMGKSVAEVRNMSKAGDLLASQVLPGLEKQMERDYGGAMAKQSQTLAGLWSTFTDTLNIGLATAINPLIPALKTGMTGAINSVGTALRLIPVAGRVVGPIFRDIQHTAAGLIPPLLEAGRAAAAWLLPTFRLLGQYVTGSLIPTVRNLWAIFEKNVAPVLKVAAGIIGGTLLVWCRTLSLFLADVLGPILRGVTGFLRDNQVVVVALAGAIGTLLIPKMITLGAEAAAAAAKQATGWAMSAAGAAKALVAYVRFSTFALRYYATIGTQATISAGKVVAGWVASAAAATASAAKQVAAWVATAARAIWATGVAIAQLIIQGARWAWAGRAALVAAAQMALAWLISIGPIAIVIASVAAVALFVITHWRQISSATARLWRDVVGFFSGGVRDIKSWVSNVTGWVSRTWSAMLTGVKSATATVWGGIREAFAAPVRFVVNTVLGGVVRAADTLLDKVHLHIPVPHVSFATGGRVPGSGHGDIVPAMLEPGEAIVPRHLVPEMAPWARSRGIPGFQSGGVIGVIGHAIGSAAHGVASTARGLWDAGSWVLSGALGLLRQGAAVALRAAIQPILAGVASMSSHFGVVGSAVGGLAKTAADAVLKFVRGKETADTAASSPAGGIGGAARWATVFAQALALAGQPSSWLGLGLRRLNQESGGDPRSVNKWDSNWLRGTPSVGLMQVIGPTFASYAGPFRNTGPFMYGVSVDPFANIWAAIQYTLGRYGSLSAWGRPGGYDDGGGKAWPSGTLGINASGETEFVWRASQLRGGPAPVQLTLNVDARGASDPAAVQAAVRKGGRDLMAELSRMILTRVGVT